MVRRYLEVHSGRQPHEILILLASLLVGALGTVKPQGISHAVAATLQPPWCAMFYGTMFLFALVTLVAIFFPRRIDGLLAERVGMWALAAYFVAYAAAVLANTGPGGLVSTILPSAFAIGNVVRAIQIKKDLARLKSYITRHPTDDEWIGEMLDDRQ